MYLYPANLPDLSEKCRSGFPVYPKGLSVRRCPCIQNRKRIRPAAACPPKIETAETAGKKDRAWAVDGGTVVLKVSAPAAFEEDKAEVLEALVPVAFEEDKAEVPEVLAPAAFEEDKAEIPEVSVPAVFEEDKAEGLKVLVPVAFEEDRAEVLEASAEDRAVVWKEVPAAVLEVPVVLAADRTDNTENREADREPALASAVLAGAPAYV